MEKNDDVYRKLQKHLDRHPVGFPKTISGAEIKVLKHIFTPKEARIAALLDYRFQSLESIYEKHAASGYSKDDLEKTLDQIASKGGIGFRNRDGQRFYCNMPLVVGMYEGFLDNLTQDFIKDFGKYTNSPSFGISFLSTAVPQMRTIPVAESVTPEHQVSSFDQVSALIEESPGPFAVVECICRKKKAMEGEKCKVTDRKETCMAANEIAAAALTHGMGREISKQEAIDLLAENTRQGMVLQPSNTQKIEFVCSCCGCCCGMLSIQKQLPRPLDFWASNYYAVLDLDKCTRCGICAKKCQVGAITVKKKNKKVAAINLNVKKCIGCGNCVAACKFDALSLIKKDNEAIPPKTFEELNETLMKNKKGTWEKVKMVSKLVLGLPQ
jgi:formate hydrogenlyase subunit 6/NADH:ubiquinone oxidoreductase subunit I